MCLIQQVNIVSLSKCTCFMSAKSVCVWMHNGLHWQSTARGSFLPLCGKPSAHIRSIQRPVHPPLKKWSLQGLLDVSMSTEKGKTLESILSLLIQLWQANMFCTGIILNGSADVAGYTTKISISTRAFTMTWSWDCLWVQVRAQLKGDATSSSTGETHSSIHPFTHSFILERSE